MNFCSPLRYPGGKNKLAKFIASVCEKNNVNGHYIEPYAGGASVALHLLMNGYVSKITINDIDRSIYAFWYSVTRKTDKLCDLIENTEVAIDNWHKSRDLQKNKNKARLLDLGFSTLFLNRTNMSGIIDGGVIGGQKQLGKYKIDCRFNKTELIRKIRLIAEYKKSIEISRFDALDLIKRVQQKSKKSSTIYYFDPPYFLKGESLYMNHYQRDDHVAVSEAIKKIKNSQWIVSYDNMSEIKNMYSGYRKIEYSLLHTARTNKIGKEVLFFSNNLVVPEITGPKRFYSSYIKSVEY